MLKRIGAEVSSVPANADAVQLPDEDIDDTLLRTLSWFVGESGVGLTRDCLVIDVTVGDFDSDCFPHDRHGRAVVRFKSYDGDSGKTIHFTATHKRTDREADRSLAEFSIECEVCS